MPAMLFFRLLAMISPTVLFFKSVFMLFDVGVMAVLTVILRLRQLSPSRLLLYAANPLVLRFIAGEGHLEGWLVMLLLSRLEAGPLRFNRPAASQGVPRT